MKKYNYETPNKSEIDTQRCFFFFGIQNLNLQKTMTFLKCKDLNVFQILYLKRESTPNHSVDIGILVLRKYLSLKKESTILLYWSRRLLYTKIQKIGYEPYRLQKSSKDILNRKLNMPRMTNGQNVKKNKLRTK